MIIAIDAAFTVHLEEADDFTSLKVVFANQNLARSDAQISGDVGYFDATKNHLFVHPTWLRQTGPQTQHWQEKLSAMLAFAQNRSWTDADKNIRAHIEYKK